MRTTSSCSTGSSRAWPNRITGRRPSLQAVHPPSMTRLDVPSPAPATAADGLAQDTDSLEHPDRGPRGTGGPCVHLRLQWLYPDHRRHGRVNLRRRRADHHLLKCGVPDESWRPIVRTCSLELQLADAGRRERERVHSRPSTNATGACAAGIIAEDQRGSRRQGQHRARLAAQLQIEDSHPRAPSQGDASACRIRLWLGRQALLPRLKQPARGRHAGARCWAAAKVLWLWPQVVHIHFHVEGGPPFFGRLCGASLPPMP